MILIVCPTTGRLVPTGLELSKPEFERAQLENNVVRCVACGRIHTWSKPDAILQEDHQAPSS